MRGCNKVLREERNPDGPKPPFPPGRLPGESRADLCGFGAPSRSGAMVYA